MMNQKTFTHINKTWNIDEMDTVYTNGGRWYVSPVGNLPSVTTVTGYEKQNFFKQWRKDNPEYNGKLSVIDFKGSTRSKKREYIDNYFLQATAYSVAWQERTHIPIDNFVILISCEDGAIQEFEGKTVNYVKPLLETIEGYHAQHTAV